MRNGKQHSDLIKACAIAYSVSERSVRNWRRAGDVRWTDFLADKAISVPQAPSEKTATEEPLEAPGEGLEFEIIRLKKECLSIARRIRAVTSLDAEATLHRILDSKRETLRKLAKDEPGVAAAAGETVPKMVVVHYAADIAALIQTLPARLATIVPQDISADIRQRIEAEVHSLMNLASNVQLRSS